MPIKRSCVEENLSQHEDEDVIETPEQEPAQPEDEASAEEEQAPQQEEAASGEQEDVPGAPPEEEPVLEVVDQEELFLSPDDGAGEVFEAEGSAEVIEILDMPTQESTQAGELKARIEELEAQLAQQAEALDAGTRERDDLKARLLRAAADMDNFRKRKEREKDELRKYGSDKLVVDLLPAVDNLERALEHAEKTAEESSISDGVRMVHRQIVSSLDKHGIRSFDSVGEKFDPQRHEAIQQVETTEFDTNVVMQEFQKGYFIHDRLLRAALTVVAKRVDPPAQAPGEEAAPEDAAPESADAQDASQEEQAGLEESSQAQA